MVELNHLYHFPSKFFSQDTTALTSALLYWHWYKDESNQLFHWKGTDSRSALKVDHFLLKNAFYYRSWLSATFESSILHAPRNTNYGKVTIQSPLFIIFYLKPFWSHIVNMVTFVGLRHTVKILVTDFTNPNNLTYFLELITFIGSIW